MSELYLKNEKVMILKDENGFPCAVEKVVNADLLPLCLHEGWQFPQFESWLKKRCIPDNREGLKDMVSEFGAQWRYPKEGKLNYASLTDQYWLKHGDETWTDINFFTNEYSQDIGNMAFEPWLVDKNNINNFSPDLTTNGVLRKRWIQNPDKTSLLIKAGSFAAKQEPLSEVLVSVFCERLKKIKSAGYDLRIEGTKMCSISKNFITENTELVPMSYIYDVKPRDKKNESIFKHILSMCDLYDIPDAEEYLRWLIFVDFVTRNGDRHLNNIAFIRDINTLKFIGPAPLFDCGAAYWSTNNTNAPVKSKQFGDVEGRICREMSARCDVVGVLKDKSFQKIINQYPGITDAKKQNLIEAIKKSNRDIIFSRDIDKAGIAHV